MPPKFLELTEKKKGELAEKKKDGVQSSIKKKTDTTSSKKETSKDDSSNTSSTKEVEMSGNQLVPYSENNENYTGLTNEQLRNKLEQMNIALREKDILIKLASDEANKTGNIGIALSETSYVKDILIRNYNDPASNGTRKKEIIDYLLNPSMSLTVKIVPSEIIEVLANAFKQKIEEENTLFKESIASFNESMVEIIGKIGYLFYTGYINVKKIIQKNEDMIRNYTNDISKPENALLISEMQVQISRLSQENASYSQLVAFVENPALTSLQEQILYIAFLLYEIQKIREFINRIKSNGNMLTATNDEVQQLSQLENLSNITNKQVIVALKDIYSNNNNNNTNNQIAILENWIQVHNDEINNIVNNILDNRQISDVITLMNSIYTVYESQITNLNISKDRYENHIRNITQQIDSYNKLLIEYEEKESIKRKNLIETGNAQIRKLIDDATAKIQQLEKEKETFLSQLNEKTITLSSTKKDIDVLKENIEKLNTEKEQLNSLSLQKQTEINQLNISLSSITSKNKELEEELGKKNKNETIIQEEISKASNIIAGLRQEVDLLKKKLEEQNAIDPKKRASEEIKLRSEMGRVHEKIRKLNVGITASRVSDLQKAKTTVQILRRRIKDLGVAERISLVDEIFFGNANKSLSDTKLKDLIVIHKIKDRIPYVMGNHMLDDVIFADPRIPVWLPTTLVRISDILMWITDYPLQKTTNPSRIEFSQNMYYFNSTIFAMFLLGYVDENLLKNADPILEQIFGVYSEFLFSDRAVSSAAFRVDRRNDIRRISNPEAVPDGSKLQLISLLSALNSIYNEWENRPMAGAGIAKISNFQNRIKILM